MKKHRSYKGLILGFYASSLLAPLAWLYFTHSTQNMFQLDIFDPGRLAICLLLELLPVLLFFLARSLQRHTLPVGGSIGACLLFLLAASSWLLTATGQWHSWNCSYTAGAISLSQLRILKTAVLTGLFSAMLPLCSQIWRSITHKEV